MCEIKKNYILKLIINVKIIVIGYLYDFIKLN